MGTSANDLQPLLKPRVVAELLGIHVNTLYRLWRQGNGPAVVHASACSKRCEPSAVRAYIAANRQELASDAG